MRSEHEQIEARLRNGRGRMMPPASLSFDPGALPARPETGFSWRVPGAVALLAIAAIAVMLLVVRREESKPSASEAVARSMDVLPESAAVTRRLLQPVKQEMQLLAMQSKRATRALRESLQIR